MHGEVLLHERIRYPRRMLTFPKRMEKFPRWTKSPSLLMQSSFLPCPLFPLTIHERVLLVLNEHFWNSACGEWLQGVDRDRRVRAVGLFNLNSNWRRKVVAVAVPLFLFASENKKFNLLLWFFMRRAPMHIPTLDVKSHWGRVFFPSVCTLAVGCLEPVVGKLYCNLKSLFQ